MKRFVLTVALLVAGVCAASAQKYVVVDSEKIFKSIEQYNQALTTLDELSTQYQSSVDAKYQQVETAYNNYMQVKNAMTAQAQAQKEQEILALEKAAAEYQESVFGNDGVIMKKRIELIQPVQNKVFDTIEKYAKANGVDMVVDTASNVSVLYTSSAVNVTDAIIALLK